MSRRCGKKGLLNPESNICFGEGGAGTFSDGKLTTRIKDPRVRAVLGAFVRHGAPEEICYEALPHLGTEHIRSAVVGIREEILRLGGAFLYGAKLCDIESKNGKISAAFYEKEGVRTRVEAGAVVLAIGHSARDTFELLLERGSPYRPSLLPWACG